jgi:hypothetical protein
MPTPRLLLPLLAASALLLLAACPTTGPGPGDDDDDATDLVCEVEWVDTECSECIEEKCADLIPSCRENQGCSCMLDCITEEGLPSVDPCKEELGLSQLPEGFPSLEECVAFACPDSDECSTPVDWSPPGADLKCDHTGTGGFGGGDQPDCGFDPAIGFDPLGDVLQLEAADGTICVRLERRDDGSGSLENTFWTILDVRVGPPGEVAQVSAEQDICWYSSHHNFRDWVHVWTGSRRFDVVLKHEGHGGPWRYYLYAFEQGPLPSTCPAVPEGEGCIDGPIVLHPYEG